jgi:GNAT superfamily N-acetyltransferase
MLVLRKFKPTDFEEVGRLHDQLFVQNAQNSQEWKAGQQFDYQPEPLNKWVVVEPNASQVLGYSAFRSTHRPDYWRIDLMVHPQWHRQGIGDILFEHLLLELYRLKAVGIHARVRGDNACSIQFLLKRGFEPVHLMVGMSLDLTEADFSRFEPVVGRIISQGIRITTLAEEQAAGVDYLPQLLTLHNSVLADWPDPVPGRVIPFIIEGYKSMLEKSALQQPQSFFIAAKGEEYLGFSSAFALGTAVHPAHRHHGIATALKVCALKQARENGLKQLFTTSANPAMIRLNEGLGYRSYSSELRLVKVL